MPWQLLLFLPLLTVGQPQNVQPQLNNNFGYNFGFPALHGVPQASFGVQPLQPFGFQPNSFAHAQGVPTVPTGVAPLQSFPQFGVVTPVAQGVANFNPSAAPNQPAAQSVQSSEPASTQAPATQPAQRVQPTLPPGSAFAQAQGFPQTFGGFPQFPVFPGFPQMPTVGQTGFPQATFPQGQPQTVPQSSGFPASQGSQGLPGIPQLAPQSSGFPQTVPQSGYSQPSPQANGFNQPQSPGLPAVHTFPLHPQFNPLFPFSFPGFPQHQFPSYGLATPAPVPYSTNQGTQYQGQIPLSTSSQIAPPVPTTMAPIVAPTTVTTTTPIPPATTTTTLAPTTTTLKVVDSRSATRSPKRPTTTTPHPESEEESEEAWDDGLPPLAPTELTNMRDKVQEEEEIVEEKKKVEKKPEKDYHQEIRTGSNPPKVLDFRSIKPVQKVPVMTRDSLDEPSETAEKEEVDAILSRVLEAVLPMHEQRVKTTSAESEFRSRA